jgi:elongation factor 2
MQNQIFQVDPDTSAGLITQDLVLHADNIHRGAGQIMPPFKRAFFCCQLMSEPVLFEPMYVADITVPVTAVSGVYSTLNQRRGIVEGNEERPGTPLCKVKAFLPVLESFGFTALLRQNTSGQAFPQMIFSHWQALNGDPLDEDSQSNLVMQEVRERKGLKEDWPVWQDYYDKVYILPTSLDRKLLLLFMYLHERDAYNFKYLYVLAILYII